MCVCVCVVAATCCPFPWAIPAVGPHVGGMPDWAWPSTDNACDKWTVAEAPRRILGTWLADCLLVWPELHSIP